MDNLMKQKNASSERSISTMSTQRVNFKLLFFIKKTRLLRNGEAPIRIRITYGGQYAETQIKRSVPVKLWSQPKERSTGKDRLSTELNIYLESIRVKLHRIHQDMSLNDELISAKVIQSRFLGAEEFKRTLYNVFSEHNIRCRQLIGTDFCDITVRRYDNCLKYIMETVKTYKKRDDILLREVDAELIRNFEFYLKTDRECAQNTVIRYMKSFKKIINLALANGWINKDPFVSIKFKAVEVNKEFLMQEEIDKIYNKSFDIPRLDLVRDIFILCCYTGLAFIDVQQLNKDHIIADGNGHLWIRKSRQKTKNMCNIPLLKIPLQILEKYKDNPTCEKKNVLLPVMCNQKMNSYLKEIADFCGIKKKITMHTARYSYASVVCLANGVSMENVAKMLGHANTRMTQHYAKVLDNSILRDMMNVEQQLTQR